LSGRRSRRPHFRAPVCVFVAIGVLGGLRAEIDGIRDAVEIVVRLRASVLVLETVAILGRVRTAIGRVKDPIAVVVELGATVLVLELVQILRFARAAVPRIGNPILIRSKRPQSAPNLSRSAQSGVAACGS
jgi:hypothetical protein